jgi:hypothetical protein
VQIREQILHLLVGHDLIETVHLGAPIFNDVGYAVVISGESAQRQVLIFEDAFQSGPFFAVR